MRGPRLPRQAGAFSEGSEKIFALFAQRFSESRNPKGLKQSPRSRRAAEMARSSVRAMYREEAKWME